MSNPATHTVTAPNSSNAGHVIRSGDADVRAERRQRVDGAEHEMRQPREAFAERIDQHAHAAIGSSLTQSGLSIHAAMTAGRTRGRTPIAWHSAPTACRSRARVARCADCARRCRDRSSGLPPSPRCALRNRERDPHELCQRREAARGEDRARHTQKAAQRACARSESLSEKLARIPSFKRIADAAPGGSLSGPGVGLKAAFAIRSSPYSLQRLLTSSARAPIHDHLRRPLRVYPSAADLRVASMPIFMP